MLPVLYFDHREHACTCVCMIENDKKHSKRFKNYEKKVFNVFDHANACASMSLQVEIHNKHFLDQKYYQGSLRH